MTVFADFEEYGQIVLVSHLGEYDGDRILPYDESMGLLNECVAEMVNEYGHVYLYDYDHDVCGYQVVSSWGNTDF